MNGANSTKRQLSKRGKKPSTYGRIVTGNVNGTAAVQKRRTLARLNEGPMIGPETVTTLRHKESGA
jgi:hypothetical protein